MKPDLLHQLLKSRIRCDAPEWREVPLGVRLTVESDRPVTARSSTGASTNAILRTPTVDSRSPREETSRFHSSSMQRAPDERDQDEEQERAVSRHARDVDSEDAVDRVDARLRHRAAHPDAVGGRTDGRRGFAVSGAAADARQGMGAG